MSAPVIVIARFRPKAEKRDELIALLTEVQAASRQEDGCASYGYYVAIDDPDSLVAVEEWRDMPALEAHLQLPHVQKLVEAIPGMLEGRPEIVAHEVTGGGGFPR